MKSIRVFLAILVSLAASSAFGQSNAKDDAALTSLVTQMATAQITFDAPGLDRIFTSDYIEISPLGEFDPREKVLGFYTPEKKPSTSTIPAVDVSETSIRNYGKFAIVIAKLTYVMSPTIPPRSIRVTLVCRKEKGSWKIASAQYTGIRPTQPQPKS